MTPDEIRRYGHHRRYRDIGSALAQTRERMQGAGQFHAGQLLGRRRPIGCIALEITQRCNLDCTLCYLSDMSEAVHDLPLKEVFRRIDGIHKMYGPGTDVQITGGDPTLRKREELVEIVRYIAELGMRPSLFTNGIKASRDLLIELADAGLVDVAFHVDLTQEREGYGSEAALNAVRQEYIERTRGTGLFVIFNTTLFDGNIAELPVLARFFRDNADIVRFASFQLQAATGRGTAGGRPDALTSEGVALTLEESLGARLSFGPLSIGHRDCNRYAVCLVAGRRVFDLYDQPRLITDAMQRLGGIRLDRQAPWRTMGRVAGALAKQPLLAARSLFWLARQAIRIGPAALAGRGRVHKLSFFIHNFMDACSLEKDRIDACSFMVATGQGAVSMCLHNARRDRYILEPVKQEDGWWQPLSGTVGEGKDRENSPDPAALPLKRLKGRARRARQQEKTA